MFPEKKQKKEEFIHYLPSAGRRPATSWKAGPCVAVA